MSFNMEIEELNKSIASIPLSKQSELIDFINKLLNESNNYEAKVPIFGCAKGKIVLSPDFDEPLEEFPLEY